MALLSKALDQWYLAKEGKKLAVWHRVISLYTIIFLLWGAYRLLFRLPVWFEEIFLKALVFGIPVFWFALKKDSLQLQDLGLSGKNLFPSVYLGLGLGMMLGLVGQIGNFIRHGGLQLGVFELTSETFGSFLLLSLVTGFWEELLFAGYILQRLQKAIKNEWVLVSMTAVLFGLLHLPALIFVHQVSVWQLLLSQLLLIILSAGNSILMLRMKNLAAPMMAHALWGVTVYLFR